MESFFKYFRNSRRLGQTIIYIVTLLVFVFFCLVLPGFFSFDTARAILIQMTYICILGLGLTFILTIGEIDISIAAQVAVPSCLLAILLRSGVPLIISFIAALSIVMLLGFLNGFMMVRLKIPSFIMTLGTYGIAQGLSRIFANNSPIKVENEFITFLFGGELFGMPKMVYWLGFLTIIAYFILHKTKYGRNLHCIGDNSKAALLYGINVNKTIIFAFIISSVFAFFVAMLDLGKTSYANPGFAEPFLLSAIIAPVIGGTSLQGGKGDVIGTFIGALFLTIVSVGLFHLGFSTWFNKIITGIFIIVLLIFSGLMEKWKREMESI